MPDFKLLAKGFINSYAQLFFADSKAFAWLLLLSTFVNPAIACLGIVAIIASILFAWWLGLDKTLLSKGTFSYNALMLGLVLGSQYKPGMPLIAMLIVGALLSVLFVVWLNTILAKYKLPSLSLSFLLSYWIIALCIRNISGIEISDSGIFRYNEWYRLGGDSLVTLMNNIENNSLPNIIQTYLKSLSAIFFQYNIIAGTIILIGLIIWSRIGFFLSLLGFITGYLFYYWFVGDFSELTYSYIGFNFILSAVAIGGFYTIPSRASFLLALVCMPLIAVLINAFAVLFSVYQLSFYSLPFVFIVLLVIMLLQQRLNTKNLALISYQHFSPEKNLYQYHANQSRFKNSKYFLIQLPFYGEWNVSQGNNGNITHKEDWRYALDFVVRNESKQTFKNNGQDVADYYCYNLPVLSPADGYIVEIIDGIDDNEITDVNLAQNWGNTIVIKHAEGLFSKLSHLKKQSIAVKVNDFVNKGQQIANCGSSGRSPEPHLHMQLQATSFVGSKTLDYPLAYFISYNNKQPVFHSFETPAEGMDIHNPIKTPLLQKAFHFVPGQILAWEINGKTVYWECMVDAWNNTYMLCKETNAIAYYINNGTVFYFTGFWGDTNSLLYEFYLAAQKILLGYYHQLIINDSLAPDNFHKQWLMKLHDFIAPFHVFLKAAYQANYIFCDDAYHPNLIKLETQIAAVTGKKTSIKKRYELNFSDNKISSWSIINSSGKETYITCVE